MDLIIQLVIFIVLMIVGFTFGTMNEQKHYRSIKKREKKLLGLPAVTMSLKEFAKSKGQYQQEIEITDAHLVHANVVLSVDYFKIVVSSLKSLLGGNIGVYETLVDRARREAVIRLKEQITLSPEDNIQDMILNLRLDTSQIGNLQGKGVFSIEVVASGTAVKVAARQTIDTI